MAAVDTMVGIVAPGLLDAARKSKYRFIPFLPAVVWFLVKLVIELLIWRYGDQAGYVLDRYRNVFEDVLKPDQLRAYHLVCELAKTAPHNLSREVRVTGGTRHVGSPFRA